MMPESLAVTVGPLELQNPILTASGTHILGALKVMKPVPGNRLMEQGIDSLSLNPDTVVETWLFLAKQLNK